MQFKFKRDNYFRFRIRVEIDLISGLRLTEFGVDIVWIRARIDQIPFGIDRIRVRLTRFGLGLTGFDLR